MDITKRHQPSYQHGQNLVEFALVLPLLLFVLMGVLDLGRVFFSTISLTNAAREGVRYLTRHPEDIISDPIFDGTKKATIEEAGYGGITITDGNIDISCQKKESEDHCTSGTPAKVEVTYEFELILGWILPKTITFARSAVMIIP